MKKKGSLRQEAEAFRERYDIDIRQLPCRALRLLTRTKMSERELAYVATELNRLIARRRAN